MALRKQPIARLRLPHPAVGLAQIAVILRGSGLDRDRFADQIDRRANLTRLKGEAAEQVQRTGMIGDMSQDLAVHSLSLGQSAGLVMSDGTIQHFLRW